MATWKDNENLTVVNILGGPGVGKSTVATDLFSKMKRRQLKVELLYEFAKWVVYDQHTSLLTEQDYIVANQHRQQRRLVGQVDYAVLDSSLLLGLCYLPPNYPPSFSAFVLDTFMSYTNINIFLTRNPDIPYETFGRTQTEDEAKDVDTKVKMLLDLHHIPYYEVMSGSDSADQILNLFNPTRITL